MRLRPEPVNIRDWQKYFEEIYREHNQKCGIIPQDVWLNLVEDLSEVSEAIREEDIGTALEYLAHVFAWLNSFCSEAGIDLQEAVWTKYPDHCPYCEVRQGCVCIGRIGKREKEKSPIKDRLKRFIEQREYEPISLPSWLEMFKKIYGNVDSIMPIEAVISHLFEEVGEVTKCLRKGEHNKILEEVADVFAWICALTVKLDSFIKESKLAMIWIESTPAEFQKVRDLITDEDSRFKLHLSFPQMLWKEYKNGCHICAKEGRTAMPCHCPRPITYTVGK